MLLKKIKFKDLNRRLSVRLGMVDDAKSRSLKKNLRETDKKYRSCPLKTLAFLKNFILYFLENEYAGLKFNLKVQ